MAGIQPRERDRGWEGDPTLVHCSLGWRGWLDFGWSIREQRLIVYVYINIHLYACMSTYIRMYVYTYIYIYKRRIRLGVEWEEEEETKAQRRSIISGECSISMVIIDLVELDRVNYWQQQLTTTATHNNDDDYDETRPHFIDDVKWTVGDGIAFFLLCVALQYFRITDLGVFLSQDIWINQYNGFSPTLCNFSWILDSNLRENWQTFELRFNLLDWIKSNKVLILRTWICRSRHLLNLINIIGCVCF